MWRIATLVFLAGAVASPIVIEVVRVIVHRRRERRYGVGLSQDIAMWGTLAGFACVLGTVISALGWFFLG